MLMNNRKITDEGILREIKRQNRQYGNGMDQILNGDDESGMGIVPDITEK
jgi:hypothetical protein